jgi:cytochrome P450
VVVSDLLPLPSLAADEAAERSRRYPLGATVSLDAMAAPDVEGMFDALRAEEPISWLSATGGWLVTSHELARTLLLPREDVTVQSEQNMVRASLGRMMLTVDREDHRRQRAPFDAVFRPRDVAKRFAAPLEELANELVDSFLAEGETDLAVSFAQPFSVRMAGHVVGLDLGDVGRIDAFYSAFAGAMVYDGDPAPLRRAEQARRELDELLLAGLDRSLEGALSHAVRASSENQMSDEELVGELRVIMFGAIETIQASVTNTMALLLGDGDALARVLTEPGLVANAVNESLRVIPPVAFVERWARRPLELGGVTVGEGEFLGVSILAANHDPAVFEKPHGFVLERANAHRALSFSFGDHHCLGYHLARLQTEVAVRVLLSRLEGLALVAADAPEGFAFRKTPRLVVAWG